MSKSDRTRQNRSVVPRFRVTRTVDAAESAAFRRYHSPPRRMALSISDLAREQQGQRERGRHRRRSDTPKRRSSSATGPDFRACYCSGGWDGIDLGEAISAVDMAGGALPDDVKTTQTPTLLPQAPDDGLQPVVPKPGDEEVVVVVQDELQAEAVQQLGTGPAPGQVVATSTEPAPDAQDQEVQTIAPPEAAAPPPAPAPPTPEVEPTPVTPPEAPAPPVAEEPQVPATKRMKCKCGGTFDVPLEPRPLEVQCPHCGTTGTLKQ